MILTSPLATKHAYHTEIYLSPDYSIATCDANYFDSADLFWARDSG